MKEDDETFKELRFTKMKLDEFNAKGKDIQKKYTKIEMELLNSSEIILTTLTSSGSDKMDFLRGEIGCLIVDEAAQATEPNLLIGLQTGVKKVLLIGDPYQLPATTISE